MNLIQIAWRNFCHRALSSILTTLSLSLGVGLVVLVLSVYGVISEAFTRNASVGYNLVVGPKGSPLQLTLNSVFYLSQPIENLPYTEYLEFLSKEKELSWSIDSAVMNRSKSGVVDTLHSSVTVTRSLWPLGDYFGEFRVVGTTPLFLRKTASWADPRARVHFLDR